MRSMLLLLLGSQKHVAPAEMHGMAAACVAVMPTCQLSS